MREIKFRAWHKKEKKMYQVLYLGFVNEDNARVTLFDLKIEGSTKVVLREDVELMEWTGLLDRSGTPIYEGDIVINHDHKGYGATGHKNIKEFCEDNCPTNVVCFGEYHIEDREGVGFYLSIDGKENSSGLYPEFLLDIGKEVISNIYANPELITQ